MSASDEAPESLTGTFTRGLAFTTLTFVLSKGVALLSMLVLTRLLRPSQFGVVAGITVILSLIELTSDLGMKATVIYEQEAGIGERVHTAFTINMLLSVVLAGVGLALSGVVAGFFHASQHTGLFRLAAVDVLLTGLGSVPDGLLMRDMLFGKRIASEVINALVQAIVGVSLAVAGAGAASLVWGVLAGTAAWTVTLWWLSGFRPRWSIQRQAIRTMVSYGVGSSALTLLWGIYAQVDPAAVGRALGRRALGLYTVAYRLPVLVLENVASQVSLVAFPALARKRVQEAEGVGPATQRLVRYQTLYSLPLGAWMAVMALPLVTTVLSSKWRDAAGVFAAVSVLSAVSSTTFALGDGFRALGRQRVMVALTALQLPLVVAAIVIAAPYGITAVAWTRTGLEVMWAVMIVVAAARILGLSVRGILEAMWPGTAAAGGVALAASAVRFGVSLPAVPQLILSALAAAVGGVVVLWVCSRDSLREIRVLLRTLVQRPAQFTPDLAPTEPEAPLGQPEMSPPPAPRPLRTAPFPPDTHPQTRRKPPFIDADRPSIAGAMPRTPLRSAALMGPGSAGGDLPPLESSSFNLSEQAVGPYLRAIRRHWLFVIIVTLVCAVAATAVAFSRSRTYSATATILVTPLEQGDPTFVGIGVVIDSGDPARTVQTADALIDSTQAATLTATAMGPGWNTQRVQNSVSVTPLGQSDVLSVQATGSSPQQAARLATTFAQQAVANRGRVVQRNIAKELRVLQDRVNRLPTTGAAATSEVSNLTTMIGELTAAKSNGADPSLGLDQTATPPTSPSGASRALIALLGLLGGFALASVGALGLEVFSRPVRDEQEFTSVFPAPVLALIPPVRHGADPVPPWEIPPGAFEQMRMLRVQLSLAVKPPVIMVTSAGAAEGKTTLVASLAAAFAESGKEVVVIDADLRRQSQLAAFELQNTASGRRQRATLTDDRFRSEIATIPRLPNVRLIHFPTARGVLNVEAILARLPLLIEQARRSASCVIIDTAPVGEVSEALRIVPMCEAVLFVGRPRRTDRRRLALARDLMARAGARITGVVLIGTTLTPSSGNYSYYDNGYLEPLDRSKDPGKTRPPAPDRKQVAARTRGPARRPKRSK